MADEIVRLAGRHLDPAEGVMQAGHVVNTSDIAALRKVLDYVARATVPARPPVADPCAPAVGSNGHSRFEDERGVIMDLLGPVDAVTHIYTVAGAVRGNHVHQHTTQWTYVVAGRMIFAWTEDDGVHTCEATSGELIVETAGVPHAWKAVTDCHVLVFTKGPRSGQAYATDTQRLPENARLLT